MKKILYLLFLLFIFTSLQGQTGTPKNDTDNSTATELLKQIRQQQLTDSLKETLLNEQMNSLKQNNSEQKQLIKKQIQQLQQQDSLHFIAFRRKVDSLKQHTQKFPVVIGTDTLCYFYANLGSFTAAERAAHSSEWITKLAQKYSPENDSLTIVNNYSTSDILFGEDIVISITDADAMWVNTNKIILAEQYKERLLKIITDYQDNISLLTRLKQIGLCLLVIFIQFLLIKGVNYCFRKGVDEKLKKKKDEWFTGIRLRDYEVLNSTKQVNALLFASKMLRYLINLVQLYITIPVLFSIFPVTQRLAETLFGWVLSPVSFILKGFVNYLPKLFTIIVIVIIMRYMIRFLKYIATEIETEKLHIPGFYPDWARATFNILRIFLYAFMLVMIFPLLPSSDTEIFKGVSVFIGVVFSLGSSSLIANIVAGMVITYMRPFKIGDRIKIGELTGDVVEKSPFVTRVKTPKNEIITVPNSNILSSSIVNYSFSAAENGLIIYTTVTIGYDVPWKQVHSLLLRAASRTEHLLATPQPFVLQTSLDDFYVSYQLCAYTQEAALQAIIYSELHQNIQDCFNEEQVEIMSPHYRANRNGNPSTVPPNYFENKKNG